MSALIAGFGSELNGDDAAGVLAVRALAQRELPAGVRCAEIGIGGIALVHELHEPYDRLVIVDAVRRGGAAGSVYVMDPILPDRLDAGAVHETFAQSHFAEPYRALLLARALGRSPAEVRIVGIEVADDVDELTMAVTPAVQRAIPIAAERALALATEQR